MTTSSGNSAFRKTSHLLTFFHVVTTWLHWDCVTDLHTDPQCHSGIVYKGIKNEKLVMLSLNNHKLHGLCAIIVFNMIFEWRPHTQLTVRSLSRAVNFKHRFTNGSQRRAPIGRCFFLKADLEYPFEHCEVINYTLDGVSIHPVTTRKPLLPLTQSLLTLKRPGLSQWYSWLEEGI